MKLRPAHALVVALLALVVAMAGTSYAALQIGSKQIKNNSVKSKDVKDKNLTGQDLKDGSVDGADVADGSLTGGDLQDGSLTGGDLQDGSVAGADVKDGSITKADLDRACPASTVAALGVCIDRASNGTMTNLTTALLTCDARGARLMTWPEYRVLVTKIPTTAWADGNPGNYELLDLQNINGTTVEPQAISYGGGLFAPATGNNLFFRCAIQP